MRRLDRTLLAATAVITLCGGASGADAVKCPVSPDAEWASIEECLRTRSTTLFASSDKTERSVNARAAFAPASSNLSAFPEAPRTLPPSLDDRLEQSKVQTLRRFEAEQNTEFQQEFRDFIESR
jgi:hypothetical protein